MSQPDTSDWFEQRKYEFYDDSVAIEAYLERETMIKLDLLAHRSFLAKMKGFPEAEIQFWELQVCSRIITDI